MKKIIYILILFLCGIVFAVASGEKPSHDGYENESSHENEEWDDDDDDEYEGKAPVKMELTAEEAKLVKEKGILQSFGQSFEMGATDPAMVSSEFAKIQTIEKNGNTYYVKKDGGATLYSTAYLGSGFRGDIEGFISVNADVTKVMGFSVTNQSDTPGLGARMTEQWFLDQLKGETIVNNTIKVSKVGKGSKGDKKKDNGRIDGISGATRTSKGIQAILKQTIQGIKKDLGK